MKRFLSLLILTLVLTTLILVVANCGGGGGGSYDPGPVVNTPTNTPGNTSTPTPTSTTNPTITATPTKIATPNINDPTPTPIYVTDPNSFGPIQPGKCHGNIVTYNISTTNKIVTSADMMEAEVADLVASGVLVLLPNVEVKVYSSQGGTLKFSGTTGANADLKWQNADPGTYWVEFKKSGYTDVKRSQTFNIGVINVCNGIFNAPTP